MKTNSLELLKIATISAAISICLAPLARADDAKTLATVNVTANRNAVPVKETLASVTVLTRADIEKSQAPDLVDLLTRQAGIDMTRTGGPGSQNSLFLRGSNSNHALVLIDGIRVNSATQGLFDFAHLPLSQIDRIEIVRGPRAAFWGSDAIGGVIQIFTRDPTAAYADAYVGSYGRAGIEAALAAATVIRASALASASGVRAVFPRPIRKPALIAMTRTTMVTAIAISVCARKPCLDRSG